MLRPLLEDETCLAGVTALVCDVSNGRFDGRAKPYLLGSFLVPVAKENKQGIRPIAIGELFYKLAATLAARTVAKKAGPFLAPLQFGVGIPDGPTTAVHALLSLLAPGDEIEPEAGLSIDIRNAFNTIARAHVLESFFEQESLASANRLLHWSYSEPAPLWVRRRDGTIQAGLSSAQGVRQGDPLGSAAFAVAFQPLLLQVLHQTPQVKIIAVHDDATFIGPLPVVVAATETFTLAARRSGSSFSLRSANCSGFVTHQSQAESIPFSTL
jgi:Reverse transcriptase (RNA-dependent DNA polymerase)